LILSNARHNIYKEIGQLCFAVPILPGGIELMKRWNEENIVNNK
jgi:hypothetical protein